MKAFITLVTLGILTFATAPAFAAAGTINFGEVHRVVASPQFAQAFAKASTSVNGFKMRMAYETNHASRTTSEAVTVIIVGRIESQNGGTDLFQQAEFTAVGNNGGWNVRVSDVQVKTISEAEFVGFKE